MAENKKIEIQWESGTHYNVRLPNVEGHELVLSVDKENFAITIQSFEFMYIEQIVKLIVQLYLENKDNPVIQEFLSFLRQPENKEELQNLQYAFRKFVH